MKAFLIDPTEKSITEVEHEDSSEDIRKLIGASLFDVVTINEARDCIYIDDEGLFNCSDFFQFDGYPAPLAGKGLVLGTDHTGRSTTPRLESVETLETKVRFVSRDKAIELAEDADAAAEQEGEKYGDSFIHISAADIIKSQEYDDSSS